MPRFRSTQFRYSEPVASIVYFMKIAHHRLALLLLPAFLPGCMPLSQNPEYIGVESEPAGAAVFVMGEKAGVTPLMVRQDAVFPLTYDPAKRDLYGTVVLRKEGCKDYKQRVSTTAYGEGVKAKLDCGAAKTETTDREPKSVEHRLRQLKDLREKGLITEEEEKTARKRILDAL